VIPYREPDFRCEACTVSGERCILTIGHQGPHALRGGDIWTAGCDQCRGSGWVPLGDGEPPHYIDRKLCECPAGLAEREKIEMQRLDGRTK